MMYLELTLSTGSKILINFAKVTGIAPIIKKQNKPEANTIVAFNQGDYYSVVEEYEYIKEKLQHWTIDSSKT